MTIVLSRLPQRQSIVQVFGIVVFAVFTWTMRSFFFLLPSFLLNQGIGKILAILCYMLAFALLESILVTGGLILLGMVLPEKWFRDGFAYKGFLAALVAAAAFIELQYRLTNQAPPMSEYYLRFGISLTAFILLTFIFHNVSVLQKILVEIVERLQIFSYIYIPCGVIGLLVVIMRNIL